MAVLAIAGLHGFGMYSVAICPKRMYDFPYVKNTSRRHFADGGNGDVTGLE